MKKNTLSLALLCLAFPLLSQVIYIKGVEHYFELDINTCEVNQIPELSHPGTDISFHPDGTLYTLSWEGELFETNINSGENTLIHTFDNIDLWNSLVISEEGVAYASGLTGIISSYNFNTGEEIIHGPTGYAASGDLIFIEGELFMASNEDRIIKIDIENTTLSTVQINGDLEGDIFGLISYVENCEPPEIFSISSEGSKNL